MQALKKDHLGLPRLQEYCGEKYKNCSPQSSRDWREIGYWMGLYDADPILQECHLNHLSAQFEVDKSYWHDIAMKRAEQLQKTYEEIARFGYPVTQDMRIFGNPKYADFQANYTSVSRTPTPLNYQSTSNVSTVTVSETRRDRVDQCEMFLQYAKAYPLQSNIDLLEKMRENLDNPSKFASFRSQLKSNLIRIRKLKDCKD